MNKIRYRQDRYDRKDYSMVKQIMSTQFIKMEPKLEGLHAFEEKKLQALLREAVSLLPEGVQLFAKNEICFVFVYSVAGCLDKKIIDGRSVVTIFNLITDLPHDAQVWVITHEIAHSFLEHSTESNKINWDHEKEADKLAHRWLGNKTEFEEYGKP